MMKKQKKTGKKQKASDKEDTKGKHEEAAVIEEKNEKALPVNNTENSQDTTEVINKRNYRRFMAPQDSSKR